ncbi:hypothetical protein K3495_g13401 [Podosphaera aphanis]|nr:hypothetical protein K3495_g13401 [Podosphaera aphanis]
MRLNSQINPNRRAPYPSPAKASHHDSSPLQRSKLKVGQRPLQALPPTSPRRRRRDPTQHITPRAPVPKQSATTKGPKAIFRLSEEAPLLRADTTAVKAAFIHIVPDLKDGIASVTRCANGFNVISSSEASLKIVMDNADSIKASLSGSLAQLEDRIGYVVKRIPCTIWNPVSNLVPTTLDDVKSIAQAQTGVAPSSAHWSLHEDCHDPLHMAVIFFPKEVSTFRIVGSALSRRYIPNPKVVHCDACFGFHQSSRCRTQALCARCGALRHHGECRHLRRCIKCLGPHSADDPNCPLRPRPFKGKLIHPSEKTIMELRSRNRNNLRKERRAEAAAATSATSTSPGSSSAATLSTEAPSVPYKRTSFASQNSFTPLASAPDSSMDVDLHEQITINTSNSTCYEQ